jgi:predicted alpha/beta superfamily hydrolase
MKNPSLLPGVELHELHSAVLERDLLLFVKLPWTYSAGGKHYLALYCTDANRSFPLYAIPSLIFETPGRHSPEILIVGVGYKVSPDRLRGLVEWGAWRTHDLLPVARKSVDDHGRKLLSDLLGGEQVEVHSGGAAKFLKALQKEIIPFVEQTYRVEKHDRGLAGYSDGGLFSLYALFHAPQAFQRCFAGSPTMFEEVFDYEEAYASSHTDLPARLFISLGGNELDLVEPVKRLVDRLHARKYPGLTLTTHVFPGEGHSSAYAPAIVRALCTLYNEDWAKE